MFEGEQRKGNPLVLFFLDALGDLSRRSEFRQAGTRFGHEQRSRMICAKTRLPGYVTTLPRACGGIVLNKNQSLIEPVAM